MLPPLGIQSWCFREFKKPEQVIPMLRECGVDRIELCGVHINPADPAMEHVLKAYNDAGITVSSFGVHGFGADEAAARKVFEFACKADFPTISADLQPGGLDVVEKLCAEYGKKIAIHNHGRHHRLGPVWALEDLFAQSSPNVGLCLDTAWMLDSGSNPVDVAKKFKDRLCGLHVKDFVFDRAGRPEDVVVGEGNLDLNGLVAFLTEMAFAGYVTLEYEGDASNPVPALKQCVAAIGKAVAKA